MKRRWLAMLVLALLIVSVVVLSGCADRSVHKETIDGQECVVRRNGFGQIVVMSCDWDN